jgi:hypothetical protein
MEIEKFIKTLDFHYKVLPKKPVFLGMSDKPDANLMTETVKWMLSDTYEITGRLKPTYDLGGPVENGEPVTTLDKDLERGKRRIAEIIYERECTR